MLRICIFDHAYSPTLVTRNVSLVECGLLLFALSFFTAVVYAITSSLNFANHVYNTSEYITSNDSVLMTVYSVRDMEGKMSKNIFLNAYHAYVAKHIFPF